MKILFLTNLLPYPLDNGGKIKTYTTICALSKAGHEIDLVCFSEKKDPDKSYQKEIEKLCASVHQVYLRLTTAENMPYMMKLAVKSLFSIYSFGLYKYQSTQMQELLQNLCKAQTYDCVYFDHLQLCIYETVLKQFAPNARYILDEHNCEALIMERNASTAHNSIKKAFLKLEAIKLKNFESRMLQSMDMNIVCLDLEGVLVPEIWIAFAEETGIPELKRTTRDEPDYDKLMNWRLGILKEHGLGLKEIQETIAKIDPIPGAKEFLDELRSMTQVIIISDTFTQFASPLMKKLGWPTIFCNSLEVAESGEITGFKMRCEKSKYTTVKALQSIGYDTIASGDSHNDLGMIRASKAGFLFKSTDQIKADNPDLPAYETYDELLAAIKKVLA